MRSPSVFISSNLVRETTQKASGKRTVGEEGNSNGDVKSAEADEVVEEVTLAIEMKGVVRLPSRRMIGTLPISREPL